LILFFFFLLKNSYSFLNLVTIIVFEALYLKAYNFKENKNIFNFYLIKSN
jgi:hypothetical protein